ncbi:hypothetical protein [Sphingomicrobium lutaoense]|uniref:Uncharacterized protein n=1 Tax=Sphingomicrobium lutaoense TaxID=515949 RepID=A0A839Z4E2_9SPHN|nr:hypothetical protein [Sphingomicrobium lutaoense]MBB3763504.1 hypothetical protein [Sphingomicrobium lutaoense]
MVKNVALDQCEAFGIGLWLGFLPRFEIGMLAGLEIAEADDLLAGLVQRLDDVRTDEAGGADDEPGAGIFGKARSQRGGKATMRFAPNDMSAALISPLLGQLEE